MDLSGLQRGAILRDEHNVRKDIMDWYFLSPRVDRANLLPVGGKLDGLRVSGEYAGHSILLDQQDSR